MTSKQRLYAIVVLCVVTIMLHLLLCRWGGMRINGANLTNAPVLILWTNLDPQGAYTMGNGIMPRAWVSRGEAAVFGVVLPFALLARAGYLLIGWRATSRRGAGRCIRCGYDLRSVAGPCPECGETRR